MIQASERIFVDTGAWIAASVVADTHHEEATALWTELLAKGGRAFTSVPVIIETYTYMQRGLGIEVARAWRSAMATIPRLEILDCGATDLAAAWPWLDRRDLYKLGIVDASSFVLMKKHKLRRAFSFDIHFATAGFKLLHS
jgi:predicted nucleic acid-binding protein